MYSLITTTVLSDFAELHFRQFLQNLNLTVAAAPLGTKLRSSHNSQPQFLSCAPWASSRPVTVPKLRSLTLI
jgi:hypothetical protein